MTLVLLTHKTEAREFLELGSWKPSWQVEQDTVSKMKINI